MLGRVQLRGGRAHRLGGARGYGLAALEAEANAAGQFHSAGAAGEREPRSAAEAEPGVGRIILFAPGHFMNGPRLAGYSLGVKDRQSDVARDRRFTNSGAGRRQPRA